MEQLCVRVGWGGNHGDTSFKMKALDKNLDFKIYFPFLYAGLTLYLGTCLIRFQILQRNIF